ncbi:MAG: 30S ribosomal protein S20 [Candidatus Aminicenantes bacterium]|nr:30S ribosomal protein S20 [Candidatus Aminicenantes bacterium]
MAKHASAIRQRRRSLRRRAVNKRNKTALRTQVKKIRDLVEAQDKDQAKAMLPKIFKTIDQTVKKGTIHGNTGARYKSRLSRQIEKISSASSK